MTREKPIVYVLRGDDHQAIKTHLANFYANLGDASLAEMNTTRLDGKTAGLSELLSAAMALPFLTERRLVILEDALHAYSGRGKQELREKFIDLLEGLPASTALVLIVVDR